MSWVNLHVRLENYFQGTHLFLSLLHAQRTRITSWDSILISVDITKKASYWKLLRTKMKAFILADEAYHLVPEKVACFKQYKSSWLESISWFWSSKSFQIKYFTNTMINFSLFLVSKKFWKLLSLKFEFVYQPMLSFLLFILPFEVKLKLTIVHLLSNATKHLDWKVYFSFANSVYSKIARTIVCFIRLIEQLINLKNTIRFQRLLHLLIFS